MHLLLENLNSDSTALRIFQRTSKVDLDTVYHIYFGWIPLPVAFCGLLLTTLHIMAVYHAIRLKRVSRKCYLLILNKSIGDILCSCSAISTAIYVLVARTIR